MQRDRLTEEGGERGKKREQRKEIAAEKTEAKDTEQILRYLFGAAAICIHR